MKRIFVSILSVLCLNLFLPCAGYTEETTSLTPTEIEERTRDTAWGRISGDKEEKAQPDTRTEIEQRAAECAWGRS